MIIPLSHALSFLIILFSLGFFCVTVRCHLLFILFGLEVMISAAALAFIIVGSYLGQEDGQIMYILVVTVATAESAISLALLLRIYRFYHTLNIDDFSEMRG